MNSGKYIFSQVIEFVPKYEFDKLVKLYKGDYHTRNFSTYNHLLHLLFGQLTVCRAHFGIYVYASKPIKAAFITLAFAKRSMHHRYLVQMRGVTIGYLKD